MGPTDHRRWNINIANVVGTQLGVRVLSCSPRVLFGWIRTVCTVAPGHPQRVIFPKDHLGYNVTDWSHATSD